MAVVSNTFETYDAIGQRESLANLITNIDPTDRPFMTASDQGGATAIVFEWQTDVLDDAGLNVQIEGDEATFPAITPTVRPTNVQQISSKTAIVSRSLDAVSKAGRDSEIAYQMVRKSRSLARDLEYTATRNQVRAAGSLNNARATASYENWVSAETGSFGAGGTPSDVATTGTPTTQVTPGTARPLTENLLLGVIQDVWDNGADGSLILVGGSNKRVISTFAGNSTRFDKGEDGTVRASIEIYISDFGSHQIALSRFHNPATALVIDPSVIEIAYLRPFNSRELAVTGDATKWLLTVEWGLCIKNHRAIGAVFALTTP